MCAVRVSLELGEIGKLSMANDPVLDKIRDRMLMMATAQGAHGKLPTGVRWWIKYCVYGRRTCPVRSVDEHSARALKLLEEELVMDFVIWLVACKPSGRTVAVDTALKYVSQVQGWVSRLSFGGGRIGGGMCLDRLRGMAKGMKRQLGDAAKAPRFGVRTQDLAEAMRAKLSGGSAAEANWRALVSVAFCALMRGGEVGVSDGETFDPALHLTRADVQFFRDAHGALYVVIMMRPLKKSAGMRKTFPVVLRGGGSFLDPVRELYDLWRLDPVKPGEVASEVPLFRDTVSGKAFRVAEVRQVVKWLMHAIGADPDRFGAHSFRIGGATAALAAGVSPAQIRLLGRWASDVAELYTRATLQAGSDLSVVIGSTHFDDIERNTFKTEELEVLPSEWGGIPLEPDLFDEAEEDPM